ncbi:hypothetical protein MIND_00527500 [Mycena indigotica]|uniref:Uncharacterized protein n=1 Tax=Mycena indigotica TaxID=2126181 RepID=A0A8H6SY70_9AGAR|nr:uncharacterized protein MIND_00527500 [Mycena indigotica]KAF7307335.1 hypothetical protein MIND_00527500 [Mycena indigotica]
MNISRGRDRNVALSATARKASEERAIRARRYSRSPSPTFSTDRKTLSRSPSPSPTSSASLSPRSNSPTPPLTLSDQLHIAYAADDLHLAKVLLLRLQGIEITSDSDPRIAAVTDEDFDAHFVPYRLDETVSIPVAPSKPAPQQRRQPSEDTRRRENLKDKERLWDMEMRRFAEERLRLESLKRMQLDQQREHDRLRSIKQKEAAAAVVDLRRRRMKPARTLNFALVPAVPPPPPRFTYDFPFTPRAARPPPAPRLPPVNRPELLDETRQPNRVSFQDVLACMQGDLFPLIPGEHIVPQSTDHVKARRQLALLETLLDSGITITPPDDKGKARAVPIRCTEAIRAPPLPSPSTSTTSSSLSRAGSWLSFGSSSRSSTSTVASSWISVESAVPVIKSPSRRLSLNYSGSGVGSWLPGARRTASPESQLSQVHVHALDCRCRDSARSPASKHPLMDPSLTSSRQGHSTRSDEIKSSLANTLGRLTALAKTMQTARKSMIWEWAILPPPVKEKPRLSKPTSLPSTVSSAASASPLPIRPIGLRVSSADVRNFVSTSPSRITENEESEESAFTNSDDELIPSATLSQLVPRSPRWVPTPPARTELPAKLPYDRVFSPPAPLPRSPWATLVAASAAARVRAGDADVDVWAEKPPPDITELLLDTWEYQPLLRDRAVPNSAFLRIKALNNYAADVIWGHASSVGVSVTAMLPHDSKMAQGSNGCTGARYTVRGRQSA